MRKAVQKNLAATVVPCICLQQMVRKQVTAHAVDRAGDRGAAAKHVVTLLLVDTEGHDDKVLESYPFGEVATWRVRFECNKLPPKRLQAVRQRLVSHGFIPLQLGDKSSMSDDVWHHPDSQ